MNAEDIVVNLVALNGGKFVGRTRLQKAAYLLHRCGAELELSFVYYHYGPYSPALADGYVDARANKRITVEERLGRYGIRYSIFRLGKNAAQTSHIGSLTSGKARRLLEKMKEAEDIVLELAATIVFLQCEGGYADKAVEETKIRKPLKSADGRLEKACALIGSLNLDEGRPVGLPG